MEDSNKDAELQQAKAEGELRKLNLEVSALRWENSWLGRLSKFATLGAVLGAIIAALVTLFLGAGQWSSDRQKEQGLRAKEADLRVKELHERADSQYRADITQLLKYPSDESQTKASAIFTLNDLKSVIETGFERDERSRKQSEVGALVQSIMQPAPFVATKTRNVDFDLAALDCEYYKKFLLSNRHDNRFVLGRYKDALGELRKGNPDFEQVVLEPNGDAGSGKLPIERFDRLMSLPLFQAIVDAYQRRVELLKQSGPRKSEGADEIKKDLDTAFCWLHGNTNNLSVARYVFGISDDEVIERYKNCKVR